MTEPSFLTLERLRQAVAGDAAAIRIVTRLQPAGGPGDKIFPPTYAGAQYATEPRLIDGEKVDTVLLDSVQSQANRIEQALKEAWELGQLALPVLAVDFSAESELEDLGRITTLDAPHRIADAILRDSLLDHVPFRQSAIGMAFTACSPNNATALFRYCPTALIFGVWDSTGPRGGLGAKFQRALVSEIVGIGATKDGVKTGSRIDPLQIQRGNEESYTIYKHKTDIWTLLEPEAERDKDGNPAKLGKNEGAGRPSSINHGNVTPDFSRAQKDARDPGGNLIARKGEVLPGGVTVRYALQTTVLSLPALRRLRFPVTTNGRQSEPDPQNNLNLHARTVLAALALAGIALQRNQGYDLRSRCLLVPETASHCELVPIDGGTSVPFALSAQAGKALVEEALKGFGHAELTETWRRDPITLTPAPKLVVLVKKSRALAATAEAAREE